MLSLFSCSDAGEKLPTSWSPDMSFRMFYYGGMTPESWSFYVSKDSCLYERHEGSLEKRYAFQLSENELNELLTIFNEQKLTQIKTEDLSDIVYDKATNGFALKVGENEYEISPGATIEIKEKWIPNYRAIYDSAYSILMQKVNALRVPITFKLDSSLKLEGKNFYITVEYTDQYFNSKALEIPDTKTFMILPGEYYIQMHETENLNGNTRYVASFMGKLNTSDSIVSISLEGDKLIVH